MRRRRGPQEAKLPKRNVPDTPGEIMRRAVAAQRKRRITTMCKYAAAIVLVLAASLCLVSCPVGCATLDAPKENPDATPKQILTAAMYRQAAYDRIAAEAFRSGYLKSPNSACAALAVASKVSDRNRAEIDAAREALEGGDAMAAADWGAIIDLIFTGIDTVSTGIQAEKNAKAALSIDIQPDELESLYQRASGNYDASLEMITKARAKCLGG